MEGRIDYLELVRDLLDHGLVYRHGHDILEEGLVSLSAYYLDQAGSHGLVKAQALHVVENVYLRHLLSDGSGVLRGQLSAVGPIDLVAVILSRVVAGGDVNARRGAVVDNGEGKLRRGPQRVEDAHTDTVGGHHARGFTGKLLAVETAVVADDHALLAGLLALGLDDCCKGLGGPADDVDVHSVEPGSHHAAQAGRAKLQGRKEAAFYLFLVLGYRRELFPLLFAERGAVQPILVFFLIAPLHLLTLLQVCS